MAGFKDWLVKGLTNPKAAEEEARAKAEARSLARGWIQRCATCSVTFAKHLKECPKCGEYVDPGMPRRTVLIRNYSGGKAIQEFQADAAFLAQYGWKPQTQSAGGVQAGLNFDIGFGLGVGGARKAKDMTVTYVRD